MTTRIRRLAALGAAAALAATAVIAMPTAAQAAKAKDKPAAYAVAAPVLKTGDRGEAVKVLQRALELDKASGYFGPVTRIAVKKLQKANDLGATGVVGVETWSVLGKAIAQEAAKADSSFGDVQVGGRFCPALNFSYGDGIGAGRGHMGLDMMGKRGEPIYAIDAGTVTRSGYQSNGAMILDIDDKKGSMWFYGHFSKILVGKGDKVQAGQLIGYMGDTGSPGAVHLHIELRPNGWGGSARDAEPVIRELCADAN
ncbi:MAG: peptidoglycan DD-metalloendopeptidase family protein [Candidatus Nanopelagicales bacterium]|jgi:murein DD-endopeptidase MepM/ murein hydrolase activator NlpD